MSSTRKKPYAHNAVVVCSSNEEAEQVRRDHEAAEVQRGWELLLPEARDDIADAIFAATQPKGRETG